MALVCCAPWMPAVHGTVADAGTLLRRTHGLLHDASSSTAPPRSSHRMASPRPAPRICLTVAPSMLHLERPHGRSWPVCGALASAHGFVALQLAGNCTHSMPGRQEPMGVEMFHGTRGHRSSPGILQRQNKARLAGQQAGRRYVRPRVGLRLKIHPCQPSSAVQTGTWSEPSKRGNPIHVTRGHCRAAPMSCYPSNSSDPAFI
jgi:hypothetical protein